MNIAMCVIRYLWAFPATAIGLLAVPMAWVSGGRASVVAGVIEVHGGWVTLLLRKGLLLFGGPAAAMTIGHVILGHDQQCLDLSRRHEHVHVRQYERWGPAMLPAYFAASLWLLVRGFDPYLDNPFERAAHEKA